MIQLVVKQILIKLHLECVWNTLEMVYIYFEEVVKRSRNSVEHLRAVLALWESCT